MAEKRYEREIDELLRRLEAEDRAPIPFRPRRRQPPWVRAWRRVTAATAHASPVELLLLAAVGLLLTAVLVRFAGVAQAGLLALLAVVCFFGGLGLAVWQGARRPYRVYGWGGMSSSGPRWDVDRLILCLRRWLRSRRG
ncbi:MAG: hypothetical protein IRZ14_11160 [Chloroflexi bacterium]|nr:hypothetical protein [Chloroflexota bacterium]